MRDENQLHAAIVEIIAEHNAEVKYSTVQNCTLAIRTVKAGSLILLRKEVFAEAKTLKAPGPDRNGFCHHMEIPVLHPEG